MAHHIIFQFLTLAKTAQTGKYFWRRESLY